MMGIAGQADIVVEVEAKAGGKGLRRVRLSLIDKRLRTTAYIFVNNGLYAILPMG